MPVGENPLNRNATRIIYGRYDLDDLYDPGMLKLHTRPMRVGEVPIRELVSVAN
jgi:hypothetical protein